MSGLSIRYHRQEGAFSLLTQARRTFEARVVSANPHVRFEAFAHSWSKPSRFNPV
jgi:hypothetical protein